MKTLKIMICALFVVCGGLMISGCGEKKKDFDISKININEFTEYVYDGNPHAVTVSYSDTKANVTYALADNKTDFKSIKDLGLVDVGTYNLYYKLSAKGYNTFTSSGTLELTIVPRNLYVYMNDVTLMKSKLNTSFAYSTEGTISGDDTGLDYSFGDDFDLSTVEYGDVYDIVWSITNPNYNLVAPNVKAYVKDYVQLNDSFGNLKAYYANIQDAIDNAEQGETVVLNNAMVLDKVVNVNKSIVIDGQNNYVITANANIGGTKYNDKKVSSMFHITDPAVELTLKDIVVNGGQSARAVSAFAGKVVIDGATITNGKSTDDFMSGGIYLTNGATLEIKDGTIYGNNANVTDYTKYGADLYIDENSQATITKGTLGNCFVNADDEIGTLVLNGGNVESLYLEYDYNGAELNFVSGNLLHLYVALMNDNGEYCGVNYELTAVPNKTYYGGKLVNTENSETQVRSSTFYTNAGENLVDGLNYVFENCEFKVPFSTTKNVGLVFNNCTFETNEASTNLYLTSVTDLIIANCTFEGNTTGGHAIDLNLYSTSCDNIVIANNVFNTTNTDGKGTVAVKTRLDETTDFPTDSWAQNQVTGYIHGVVLIAGNDFNAENSKIEIGTTPQGNSTTANSTTGAFNVLVQNNLDSVTIYNLFKIDANTSEENYDDLKIRISIATDGVYDSTK